MSDLESVTSESPSSPSPRAPLPPERDRRRRPSGAPPPLPHHLRATGLGWLLAAIAIIVLTAAVFGSGLHGIAIGGTVVDDTIVRWVSGVHGRGIYKAARILTAVSSWWTVGLLSWGVVLALMVLRRWRHLLIFVIVLQLANIVEKILFDATKRPRPFGVPLRAGWGGWSMPSMQYLAAAGTLVVVLYTLVPDGRPRNIGKWAVGCIVAVIALARMHLGVDAPSDLLLGLVIAVAFPVVAFRAFAPNDLFPVAYRKGRSAHLDITGARGVAVRTALVEQLGIVATDIQPVGLAGSAGSTPLRLRVEGLSDEYLFGKLYSRTHLRSDRWYKLGRELLYGRLEDEKPFNAVRRLVQQEDYALRVIRDAGLPSAVPYGFVELTPEREYLLVTEFYDGAVELGEAEVDGALIDQGLRVVRQLWDAGLAHRDIKPANLMVRDGTLLLIDVAFAEMRPTPWRQAVDLANMMLCLGLRSSAEEVYERALRQFTVEEITEGFAAARGLALPSQLRRALRSEGRDLHGEFLALLPHRPRPIKVQRWTPRRMVLCTALALVVLLLGLNAKNLFANSNDSRTPLDIGSLDCGDLEPMWLEAQAVQTASRVPCVASLPLGWSFGQVTANSGTTTFTANNDRGGVAALKLTFTRRCDLAGTQEIPGELYGPRRFESTSASAVPLDRTWFEVFDGGCTKIRLHSSSSSPVVLGDLVATAPAIVGYADRATLADALQDRSDGRLHLDARRR